MQRCAMPRKTPAAKAVSMLCRAGDWLGLLEEMLNDALALGIVANVFRCSSAWNHQGCIFRWVDVGERHIRVPTVAGFSVYVSYSARNRVPRSAIFLCRRRNPDFIAFLRAIVDRAHHLERFGGVAGQYQNLRCGHGVPRGPFVEYVDSPCLHEAWAKAEFTKNCVAAPNLHPALSY